MKKFELLFESIINGISEDSTQKDNSTLDEELYDLLYYNSRWGFIKFVDKIKKGISVLTEKEKKDYLEKIRSHLRNMIKKPRLFNITYRKSACSCGYKKILQLFLY